MKQILKEIVCVLLRFGHEYRRYGNQNGTYLKCIKCGKKVQVR